MLLYLQCSSHYSVVRGRFPPPPDSKLAAGGSCRCMESWSNQLAVWTLYNYILHKLSRRSRTSAGGQTNLAGDWSGLLMSRILEVIYLISDLLGTT